MIKFDREVWNYDTKVLSKYYKIKKQNKAIQINYSFDGELLSTNIVDNFKSLKQCRKESNIKDVLKDLNNLNNNKLPFKPFSFSYTEYKFTEPINIRVYENGTIEEIKYNNAG